MTPLRSVHEFAAPLADVASSPGKPATTHWLLANRTAFMLPPPLGKSELNVDQVAPSGEVKKREPATAMNCPLAKVTALKVLVVPEDGDAHVIPSDDVRTVPLLPTATNLLLANVTPFSELTVFEV